MSSRSKSCRRSHLVIIELCRECAKRAVQTVRRVRHRFRLNGRRVAAKLIPVGRRQVDLMILSREVDHLRVDRLGATVKAALNCGAGHA